jgi:hypothetical protein
VLISNPDIDITYHPVFWVSGASSRSRPSGSVLELVEVLGDSSLDIISDIGRSHESQVYMLNVPRSLTFQTPGAAAELCRRVFLSSGLALAGGELERPWTAESTLERGSDMMLEVFM